MRLGTIAFLLGIVFCQTLPSIQNNAWIILLFILLTFSAFFILARYHWLFLFILGLLWASLHANFILAQKLPSHLEGKEIKITGTIINLPSRRQYRHNSFYWQFDFAPIPSQAWANPGNIRLNWSGDPPQELRPGQKWQLTVRLKQVHGTLNPGTFDSEAWLFQHHIRATGSVRTKSEQRLLNEPSPFNIDNLRYRLAQAIRKDLGEMPSTGIIIGLAVGDKQWITRKQKEVLQQTGTTHLIVISGLHIGFIAWLTFWIARRLWGYIGKANLWLPAPYFAAFSSFFAAFLYALLAGFSIPTQRALIMVAIALSGIVFARQTAVSHILAHALLFVLLWDPLSVMSAGFWLSFGAVAVIAYALSNRREPSISALSKWGLGAWKIQWVVMVGLFAIFLAVFGYVSLVQILANPIAIPWFSFVVVPLTLLGSALILILPTIGSVLLHLAAYIIDALWISMDWLAHFDWTVWQQHSPPLWTVIVAMIGGVILLLPRGFPARWLGILWLLPIFFIPPPHSESGEVWFTLLDVGQGLAAVVRTENYVLIYDTGTKYNGESVILPFLRNKGIQHIDKLLISHDDNDHSGGAESVLENFTVAELLTSVPTKFKKENGELENLHLCQTGQHWRWDGVDFQILHPPINYKAKDNNRSCVLKVTTAGGTLLLTGDIEARAEYRLVGHYPLDLKADILIVPHHGSGTSSTKTFIDTVQPTMALFSADYRSRFGHPKKSIVQRYRDRQIEIWNTAETGAISIRLSDDGISTPILAREQLRRYWHHYKSKWFERNTLF